MELTWLLVLTLVLPAAWGWFVYWAWLRIWAETGKTIVFVTHSIEEAVAIGTTLVMFSARPARVRELIRHDGTRDPHALIDHLNRVIMDEVLRQQGEVVTPS